MRRKNRAIQNKEKVSWGRASGEDKWYFILHNVFSMCLFFLVATRLRLFSKQSYSLFDIISFDFLGFICVVIGLTILLGLFARVFAYCIFYLFYRYSLEKHIKSYWSMNKGINEMTTYSYFISVILNSILFSIGVVTLIQLKLFQESSLYTLIGAYIIIKIGVYLFVWAKYK